MPRNEWQSSRLLTFNGPFDFPLPHHADQGDPGEQRDFAAADGRQRFVAGQEQDVRHSAARLVLTMQPPRFLLRCGMSNGGRGAGQPRNWGNEPHPAAMRAVPRDSFSQNILGNSGQRRGGPDINSARNSFQTIGYQRLIQIKA